MIRRPPRSTLDRSSAASDVYKRQYSPCSSKLPNKYLLVLYLIPEMCASFPFKAASSKCAVAPSKLAVAEPCNSLGLRSVSYTHLRAHETVLDLVCRLLLEKKTKIKKKTQKKKTKKNTNTSTDNVHSRTNKKHH